MSRLRAVGVVGAAVVVVMTAASFAERSSTGIASHGRAIAARLYYETCQRSGCTIWSTPIGPHSRKQRVIRVAGEVGGIGATASYVFWTSFVGSGRNGLYRADRSGSHRVRLVSRLSFPRDVVVAGGRVYWIDEKTIGRVRLDGTGLQRSFVRATSTDDFGVAAGLATDGIYLYFTRCAASQGAIGRIRLDGTDLERAFIRLPELCPTGLAYTTGRLYWVVHPDTDREVIGRAAIDGTRVEPRWFDSIPTGLFDLAAGDGKLFWTWGGARGVSPYIGEATVDGRIVTRHFARGIRPSLGP